MQRFARITLAVITFTALLGAISPPDPDFAPLGGSFGQTMRLLVSALPPDPCFVSVGFHPSLAQPPDPDRTFNLAPGQTAFLDLDLSKLAPRFGVRVEVRPVVHVLGGRCAAAAEVFEVFTGRSTAYMRLVTGLSQPPDPDFAPLSVAPGQALRLAVARGDMKGGAPPDPCRAVLSFADAQGAPTGSSQLVDLAPGQIAFLDINPSRLTTNALAAGRTMIQPRLSAAPAAPVDTIGTTVGGSLAGCLASVQLYDSATGWSTEVVQGR